MKTLPTALALTLLLSVSAQADDATHNMPGMQDHAMPGSQNLQEKTQDTQTHRRQGTVNSVDAATGKVNLTHEPIESLGWKTMTMGFSVKDPASLKNLTPGAAVEFELQKSGAAYLVTAIKPLAKPAQKSSSHVDDAAHPHTH